jgi:hypothetical protein
VGGWRLRGASFYDAMKRLSGTSSVRRATRTAAAIEDRDTNRSCGLIPINHTERRGWDSLLSLLRSDPSPFPLAPRTVSDESPPTDNW